MIYTNDIIKKKKNRNKKIKTIIKIIMTPIIAIIVLSAIYICYLRFIKKDNNINILGFKHYIVMTGSMEPHYNIGDLVVVKEIKKEDIKLNDVITYSINNTQDTISHRIIEIVEQDGEEYYRTKGDNNNAPDTDLVSFNNIQGKIVFKISKMGVIITELTTGTGIIIVFIVAILSYVHTNRKEERRIAREDARSRFNKPRYKKEEII